MGSFSDASKTAASIVQSAFLAVTLLFVEALLYHGKGFSTGRSIRSRTWKCLKRCLIPHEKWQAFNACLPSYGVRL